MENKLRDQRIQTLDDLRAEQVQNDDIISTEQLCDHITRLNVEINQMNSEYRHYIKLLEFTPISDILECWLRFGDFSKDTKRNYTYYINDLVKIKILPEYDLGGTVFTIGHLNHVSHEDTIRYMQHVPEWAEGTRQTYIACYLAFLNYLRQISYGWFKVPEQSKKIFKYIPAQKPTNALTLREWTVFSSALHGINQRDWLIARCTLHAGKRISEILELTLNQVDFVTNTITFSQKSNGSMKQEAIAYPSHFMNELSVYIQNSQEQRKDSYILFVTRAGKTVTRARLNHSFAQASQKSGITRVSPQSLKTTWKAMVKKQKLLDKTMKKIISQNDDSPQKNEGDKKIEQLIWI